MAKRSILIVGGGTAGWLSAAYLARHFALRGDGGVEITLLESPEIGIIGVGEGAFPTIRSTLQFLGIDEARFIRATQATFKQGIRFVDWLRTPAAGKHAQYFHPFDAPFHADGSDVVLHWLRQDPASRAPFAEAVTIQNRVAQAQRAPKRPHEDAFTGPLSYAYHFDAAGVAQVLAERAVELGVRHLSGRLDGVALGADGSIDHVRSDGNGALRADLYLDCSGFRAELIGRALESPFRSAKSILFTDRALACKLPHDAPNAPIESYTVATAHEAGWLWDIGLAGARGIGCVYSSAHLSDAGAAEILSRYVGPRLGEVSVREIPFEPGYRERQWVKNCVAIGLAGGFMEPLESTGVVLIEAAAAMVAELLPLGGPIDQSSERFNALMAARYDTLATFLKLHYCLSERTEPFWRDNRDPASIPERLRALLAQWRYRPPSRFDFRLDVESFAYFNYQYILYGMGFTTEVDAGTPSDAAAGERLFARIRSFGERATQDLPTHRALIDQINRGAGLD